MMGTVIRHIQYVCVTFLMFMMSMMLGILGLIAPSLVDAMYRKERERLNKMNDVSQELKDDFRNGFLKWGTYKHLLKQNYCNIVQLRAYEGQPAPNPPLVDIDGSTLYHLLDFVKKDRPLVVNFGSCS